MSDETTDRDQQRLLRHLSEPHAYAIRSPLDCGRIAQYRGDGGTSLGAGYVAGAAAEALVARLWANRPPSVVSFGTDGAFFQKAGLDTIVIGPGGMAQMHQPDEFITEEAMDEGLQFLERLLDEMSGRTA